ncbi:MAG TPA: hypothetical protein VL551_15490 [Actinospica sp.]|jgi:hypothetical protein|nr:hypothetical protein [Actinospica sp.]
MDQVLALQELEAEQEGTLAICASSSWSTFEKTESDEPDDL